MNLNGKSVARFVLLVAGALTAGLIATTRDAVPEFASASIVPTGLSLVTEVEATDGEELYRNYCAVCHGAEGRGDGPATSSLDPPPPDLTDGERMQQLTDERLLEVLSSGVGAMTGFGSMLTREELEAVAEYVRTLSQAPDDKPSEEAG